MISAITSEPAIAGGAHMADYRHRATPGARPLLHNSTPMAARNAGAGNDSQFAPPERATPAQPEPPRRDPSSMFAAAVIAGALPPTPQTMEELMLRIGMSTIPAESEARLKDLMA